MTVAVKGEGSVGLYNYIFLIYEMVLSWERDVTLKWPGIPLFLPVISALFGRWALYGYKGPTGLWLERIFKYSRYILAAYQALSL